MLHPQITSYFSLSFLVRLVQNFVFVYVCVVTLYRVVVLNSVTNSWLFRAYDSCLPKLNHPGSPVLAQ